MAGAVVAGVVVGGGFGWPGWWRGAPPSSAWPSSASPCALLAPADVDRAIGVVGLVSQDRGTRYDPVTGSPFRVCTYAANGIVLADIETGEFPADRLPGGAGQLAYNVAATATDTHPATVAGTDAALWATDLGDTPNLALITVRTTGSVLNLLVVALDQATDPTEPNAQGLVSTALKR